jgi:hypothetical protein
MNPRLEDKPRPIFRKEERAFFDVPYLKKSSLPCTESRPCQKGA